MISQKLLKIKRYFLRCPKGARAQIIFDFILAISMNTPEYPWRPSEIFPNGYILFPSSITISIKISYMDVRQGAIGPAIGDCYFITCLTKLCDGGQAPRLKKLFVYGLRTNKVGIYVLNLCVNVMAFGRKWLLMTTFLATMTANFGFAKTRWSTQKLMPRASFGDL